MKILTLICNFLLLGFPIMAVLTGNEFKGTSDIVLKFSLLLVPVLNIVVLSGSQISLNRLTFRLRDRNSGDRKIEQSSNFRYFRILAIVLNVILAVLVIWIFENVYPDTNGTLVILIKSFIILTPILTLLIILISKANNFADLKRTLVLTGVSLFVLLFGTFLTMYILIGQGIRENINIAKGQYPGNAEDALIAYLSDTTRSPRDRGRVAVWTLGQLNSKKALPVLYKYYKNDPEGKLCDHNTMLCQYGIHKAIVKIEKGWFTPYARLNK